MDKGMLAPYLNFDGNCEEAMKFYQSVFGGELEISRFGDIPGMEYEESSKGRIMHSTLSNDVLSFMASDGRPETPVVFGDSVGLSLAGGDDQKLTGFFDGLSEGGTVTMPVAKQAWGDKFGMVTDKFGIHWLVNITVPKEASV